MSSAGSTRPPMSNVRATCLTDVGPCVTSRLGPGADVAVGWGGFVGFGVPVGSVEGPAVGAGVREAAGVLVALGEALDGVPLPGVDAVAVRPAMPEGEAADGESDAPSEGPAEGRRLFAASPHPAART